MLLAPLETALLISAEIELDDLRARFDELEKRSEARIGDLENQLRSVRASRFWKLRNAWFRLKKRLGLIDEIWP